jgi:hypothetical protein
MAALQEAPVILSGVRISRGEILAESKDPYKLISCWNQRCLHPCAECRFVEQ